MPGIPYADPNANDDAKVLAHQIKKEEGARPPRQSLSDAAQPPVFRGWLNFLTAVRQQTKLPGRMRELVILLVGSDRTRSFNLRPKH